VNPFELGGVSPLAWRELQARGAHGRARLRCACAGCALSADMLRACVWFTHPTLATNR